MEADYVQCDWKPRGEEQSRRGENFSQSPSEEVSINNLWSVTIATYFPPSVHKDCMFGIFKKIKFFYWEGDNYQLSPF
jgi:hypothetical protein